LRPSNALPFSSKPAAESAPRFYTDVPAAGLPAATACSAARSFDELNAIALGVFDDGLVIPIACDPWHPYHTNTAFS
jgi:hypothetical protein